MHCHQRSVKAVDDLEDQLAGDLEEGSVGADDVKERAVVRLQYRHAGDEVDVHVLLVALPEGDAVGGQGPTLVVDLSR